MFAVAKIRNRRLWKRESTSCVTIVDLSITTNPNVGNVYSWKFRGIHLCFEQSDVLLLSPLSSLLINSLNWWIWMTNSSWKWTVGYLIYQLAVHFLVVVAIRYCQQITQDIAEDFRLVGKHLHHPDYNFGIYVNIISWPGHDGSDHHRLSLLMVFSHVHYYAIDTARAILTGANIKVRTQSNR